MNTILQLENELDMFKEYMNDVEDRIEYYHGSLYLVNKYSDETKENIGFYYCLIAEINHRYKMLNVFSSLYKYKELQTLRELSYKLNTDVINVIGIYISGIKSNINNQLMLL